MKNTNIFFNLVLIFLLSLSFNAQAKPVNFNFVGIVNATDGTLSGVDVGTSFIGSFGYESSTPSSYDFGVLAIYSLGSTSFMTANIGGHTVVVSNLSAYVLNGTGDGTGGSVVEDGTPIITDSNVADGITLGSGYRGYPLLVDGEVYNNGYFGINLASKSGYSNVFVSTALPLNYNLSDFNAGSRFNYGVLQRDGGQNGTILQFTIQEITSSVPEPESYVMLLAGFGLIAFRLRRTS